MRLFIKGAAMVVTIIALFVASTVGMPPVASAELTAEEKALEFLSSVVGIDLAKYTLTSPSPPPDYNSSRYPPQFCGLVKEECPSFTFEADGSKISVMSIFHNGQIGFLKIDNIVGGGFFSPSDTTPSGDYIYLEPPAADLLSQARTTLQRYQVYAAQVYGTNNSYLEPMQDILNNIEHLSPMNVTIGNINFQVSENENKTLIQWIYTENDVIMKYKKLELAFRDGAFESIIDNWRLYSVSGPSVITAEEAYEIALDAAQNYEMRVGYANGATGIATLPDLSTAFYQMHFGMSPYRNDPFQTRLPSKIPRDPFDALSLLGV